MLGVLEKYQLDLDDVVGQCYDGGSNLAAGFRGVRGQILQKNAASIFPVATLIASIEL